MTHPAHTVCSPAAQVNPVDHASRPHKSHSPLNTCGFQRRGLVLDCLVAAIGLAICWYPYYDGGFNRWGAQATVLWLLAMPLFIAIRLMPIVGGLTNRELKQDLALTPLEPHRFVASRLLPHMARVILVVLLPALVVFVPYVARLFTWALPEARVPTTPLTPPKVPIGGGGYLYFSLLAIVVCFASISTVMLPHLYWRTFRSLVTRTLVTAVLLVGIYFLGVFVILFATDQALTNLNFALLIILPAWAAYLILADEPESRQVLPTIRRERLVRAVATVCWMAVAYGVASLASKEIRPPILDIITTTHPALLGIAAIISVIAGWRWLPADTRNYGNRAYLAWMICSLMIWSLLAAVDVLQVQWPVHFREDRPLRFSVEQVSLIVVRLMVLLTPLPFVMLGPIVFRLRSPVAEYLFAPIFVFGALITFYVFYRLRDMPLGNVYALLNAAAWMGVGLHLRRTSGWRLRCYLLPLVVPAICIACSVAADQLPAMNASIPYSHPIRMRVLNLLLTGVLTSAVVVFLYDRFTRRYLDVE